MAKKPRRVPKDKSSGLPKKYLSGTSGAKRRELANVLERISTLYKQGKKIPQSLIRKRTKQNKTKHVEPLLKEDTQRILREERLALLGGQTSTSGVKNDIE